MSISITATEASSSQVYDAVVVGAGPAGLAAVLSVAESDPSARVLLLEGGRRHTMRPCPVDHGLACSGCAGVCNVVSGFGGSMHYGDGVKLSMPPSGKRLLELMGEQPAVDLAKWAMETMTAPLEERPDARGDDIGEETRGSFARHGLTVKEYAVTTLGESDLRTVLESLHDSVDRSVDYRHHSRVAAVTEFEDGFKVTYTSFGRDYTVDAANVVFATGRAGLTSTQVMLKDLRVQSRPPRPSVGVRFEMPAQHLATVGYVHPDVKVSSLSATQIKAKSFCFCGGSNGGRIKFTRYQSEFPFDVITLDGHETLERESGDRPLAANFGLLVQGPEAGSVEDAEFQRQIFGRYRELSRGRPAVQTLRSFVEGVCDKRTWPEIMAQLPFEPSVADLTSAPVHELFTDFQRRTLSEEFNRFMAPILELEYGDQPSRLLDEVIVIGLEAEFLWDEVAVSAAAETSVPGIFVAGDAAGLAQGIIQAMMLGAAAGREIARRVSRAADCA